MEQNRISSTNPGAIFDRDLSTASPADDADEGPPVPSGMSSVHLPAIVDPLEPLQPDTAFDRTRGLRHDGWTPDKMRAFLERFAECGVISEACAAVGISARSAYNLRDRDPLFAAGWDAACLKARPRLADEVFARSMTGVVERIYKDGVVVAERHRHDNRLSMAVLARLDARLDRAAAEGAPHLDLAARWDDFLAALGEDRRADVAALLVPPETEDEESAKLRELHELHPAEEAKVDAPKDPHRGLWQEENGRWWTDYPPPPDFTAKQHGRYGERYYRRPLSPSEQAAVDARRGRELADAAAQRDAYFAGLVPAQARADGTAAAP